jgi:cytochrome b
MSVRVWDLPTRLFHWLLVLLIALQYATAEFHFLDMEWHFWFGYATLALIVFRVLWGIFGSQTSRFTAFVHGPSTVFRHTVSLFSNKAATSVGHNPLGGWSVLVLLASVLLQAISGLFASDGIDTQGPLSDRVTTAAVKMWTHIHEWNQNVLLILIGLHVVAIALYYVLRKENLLAPMITGRKLVESTPLHFAGMARAFVILAIAIAVVATLVVWATAA